MAHRTIEFRTDGDWWLVEHDEYPRSSVLAGQYRRSLLVPYDTREEAEADNPGVEVVDGGFPSSWLPGMSDSIPDWFDPADCGERWDEDY